MAIVTGRLSDVNNNRDRRSIDPNEHCARGIIQLLTPQFMSSAGDGAPDVPDLAHVEELECLSCVTPTSNNNKQHNCVNARTKQTVRCKTMAWLVT